MNNYEMSILKQNILGGMDSYIRELGDEDIWEVWIAYGVPDGATEDDLQFIAEDDELWRDTCGLFGQLIKREQERAGNRPYFFIKKY